MSPAQDDRSHFWESVSTRHRADLDRYGYGAVKRHQALEYFTWQWGPLSIFRDSQFRFLLTNSDERIAAWRGPEVADDRWEGVPWSRMKRRLYTFAVRLLWDYARHAGDARVLELPEPELGSPLPVYHHGRLISQDLANAALETAAMAPVLSEPRSFLEVGAGYGRNAYALLSLYPEARYTVVDIEPALSISRWYLGQLFDPQRLTFVEAGAVGEIGPVDVAFTISSLQEMTPAAVSSYLALFDRIAGSVYIKQWTTWHNPHDKLTMTLADYPFPSGWRRLHWATSPVQTKFTEGLWRTTQQP